MTDPSSDRGSLRITRKLELTTTYPPTARLHVARHEWERLRRCIASLPKQRSLFRDLAFACLGIAIPSFLTAITLSLQAPDAPNWLHIVYWTVAVSTFLSFVLCLVLEQQVHSHVSTEISEVLAEMQDIEHHSAQSQEQTASWRSDGPNAYQASETVFSETFETFVGWTKYRDGVVLHSTEVARSYGHSLKKDRYDNPHGGYKKIGRTLGHGFVFSGWIFNPANRVGGRADRLALEDENFNGYGFAVEHSTQRVYFEKRTDGQLKQIGKITKCQQLPTDDWYRFQFYVLDDNVLQLRLFDSGDNEIHRISTRTQGEYGGFDRVTVHGGHQYYVDNLSIELRSTQ